MSTYNTELDSINNICSLVGEILELSLDIRSISGNEEILQYTDLIVAKAKTIKSKAQAMENRLKEYRSAIQSLGFKRIKPKGARHES